MDAAGREKALDFSYTGRGCVPPAVAAPARPPAYRWDQLTIVDALRNRRATPATHSAPAMDRPGVSWISGLQQQTRQSDSDEHQN